MKKAKLVADKDKCDFFVKRVTFCGHILEEDTMQPDPSKLLTLEKWTLPKTITAMRGLLRFCNHHSAYDPKYAELAAPLDD